MIALDIELLDRMTSVFLAKAQGLPKDGFTDEEWLRTVIATTIADTDLILSGAMPIDAWEGGER